MPKRGTSNDATSPSKKRTKSGGQARLDAFFQSPNKPRAAARREGESPAERQNDVHSVIGSTTSHPFVIDVDEEGAGIPVVQPAQLTPTRKGKEVQKLTAEHKSVESGPLQFCPLDVDSVFYCPAEQPWLGASAPYAFLAHTLATLSQTRSRVVIINTLTNCLHTIISKHSESLLPSLYLLSNTLAPPYAPVELGLGPSIISRSIQNVSGVTPAALKRLYNSLGDPGDVAFSAKSNLRTLIPHPPLTISFVYDSLLRIAHSKGKGAARQKEKIVEKLLLSTSGEETRFLTRTLCQNIRVGAVRTSMLTALARAIVLARVSDELEDEGHIHASSALITSIKPLLPNRKKQSTDPSRVKLYDIFSRAEVLLKGVFVKHPNYNDITSALLDGGFSGLEEKDPLTIGIPLHPTLGSPTRSLAEVYERLGGRPFTAEFKYDGQRAQVHAIAENGRIVNLKIFSRHLEDMTTKYPDIQLLIQSLLEKSPSITSFILDSEIVAVDPRTGSLKTFQELSSRAKKDVLLKDVHVSVCLYAFDLMCLNGETLLQRTFRERRSLLRGLFPPCAPEAVTSARFAHVESMDSESEDADMEEFWERSIGSQCEGLMIKLLGNAVTHDEGNNKEISRRKPLPSTYEPDKRTAAWLKLKKDYVAGATDSLDLVPIGAWYGNGRKFKWWSPILMGLYDPESGQYVAVCKCMSGFTDKFYQDLKNRYSLLNEERLTCSIRPLWECEFGGFKPDVYFQPQEVWEIQGADVTLSPVSVAAKGMTSLARGSSIRFPRFIKLREDKSIEQASTPEFLANLWRKQGSNRVAMDGDEEDLVDADFRSSSVNSGDLSSEDEI